MELKTRIDQDLKSALLARDKTLATTLRGLKSVILNVEIATGKREDGLKDNEIIDLFRKEAKKRQESAELYKRGGSQEKADAELTELHVIEKYLPVELTDEQLDTLVDKAMNEFEEVSLSKMGQVIGRVKNLSNGQVDGGRIAAAVKKRMEQK